MPCLCPVGFKLPEVRDRLGTEQEGLSAGPGHVTGLGENPGPQVLSEDTAGARGDWDRAGWEPLLQEGRGREPTSSGTVAGRREASEGQARRQTRAVTHPPGFRLIRRSLMTAAEGACGGAVTCDPQPQTRPLSGPRVSAPEPSQVRHESPWGCCDHRVWGEDAAGCGPMRAGPGRTLAHTGGATGVPTCSQIHWWILEEMGLWEPRHRPSLPSP